MLEDEKFYIINNDKNIKKLTITLNMKNKVVRRFYEGRKNTEQAEFLCGMIICLAVSEAKAEMGRDRARDVRYAFNEYIGSIKQFNDQK